MKPPPKTDRRYSVPRKKYTSMQGRSLTRAQAEEIRDRALSGEKLVVLAAEFDIHYSLVSLIKNGKRWQPLEKEHGDGDGSVRQ